MSRARELFYANPPLESKKWSPLLVVFQAANALRKSQNTPASVFLVIKEVNFVLLHFHSSKPSSLICVCVWSVGWNSTAVKTKQLKEQSQIFGIQGDVNSLLFGRKLFRTDEVRKPWSVRTANPELSVVIFKFFFSVALCMKSQGTTFFELNILYLLHLSVFSHSPSLPDNCPLLVFFPFSEARRASGCWWWRKCRREELHESAILRMKFRL